MHNAVMELILAFHLGKRGRVWAGARICALLALPLCLPAGVRISQYQKTYWAVEQGLPHSYVTAIAHAPEGYLLVGTYEGLARFDGREFRPLDSKPSLRLGETWTSALLLSRDGSLWVGTFEGTLARLREGKAMEVHATGGSIFALAEDGEGAVWASSRSGVRRWKAGRLQPVAGVSAPLESAWNVLAAAADGAMWVADASGLKCWRQGGVSTVVRNGGASGDVLAVLRRQAGGVWVGTTRGLYRLEGAAQPLVEMPGVQGPVTSLLEESGGTLWAGSWGHGLYRWSTEGVARWAGQDGLPDDHIRTLAEDSEGNLWIGMRSGGLGRWKEPRIVPYGTPEGLSGNYAATVAEDGAGNLWLGTWRGGLYRRRDGVFAKQPTPTPEPEFAVRAMAFDRQGGVWLGNWEGVFELRAGVYRRYAKEADAPYGRVSALQFDRQGGLWIGTADRGLFYFAEGRPGGRWQVMMEGATISALLGDSRGRMWVGTNRGLAYFEGGELRRAQGLGEALIEALFEDSKQRVWASTSGGELLVEGERRVVLGRQAGLPAHALYRVLEDDGGTFWVSSPRGILQLPGGPLEAVLSGKRKTLEVVRHGQDDGMRTIECHGLSQPAGWKARDGSLWFPTARGFVRVWRMDERRPLPPPKVEILETRTEAMSLPAGAEVTLAAGARNLEIVYTAFRLTNQEKVQFRYRMLDYDPDWVEAGNARSARYNQLPPGRRRFEVQARDAGGEWGPVAALRFVQTPRFYQTWWFLALMAALSVGVVWGGYRWRLHTVRGRFAAVREERNRIGREWHDTLVAGFSAISLQIEAAMARLEEQPERSFEILDVTKKMVHHYRAEARRVIWDLRDSRQEGEPLAAALEHALRRVTERREMGGRVQVEGTPVEQGMEVEHNLLRICQEAMSNAARHGAPSKIDVTLAYRADSIEVSVEDDGNGFDYAAAAADQTGHFGLAVMEERARRLGGRLEIESRPGSGTIVRAVVPIRAGTRK